MQTVYLVTGNTHKLADFKRLLPADFMFESVDIDLPEIQSLNSAEIINDKAVRAYQHLGKPLLVEDVTAGLDKLHGLPGPFIKFFEKKLGQDALFQLAGEESAATVTSTLGYYDGEQLIISQGVVRGTVVAARGKHGFGFDCCFVPSGQDSLSAHPKTYAEMTPDQKDAISHRSISVKAMLDKLKQL